MAQVFRIMELNLKKHSSVLIGVGAFILIASSLVIGTFLLSSKTDVTVNSTVTTTENVSNTKEHNETGIATTELENTTVNDQLIKEGQSTSHSGTVTSNQNKEEPESNLVHTMKEKDYQNTNVAHNTTSSNSNGSNDLKNTENLTVNNKPTVHTTESNEQRSTSNTATENNTALSNLNENTEKPNVNNTPTTESNEKSSTSNTATENNTALSNSNENTENPNVNNEPTHTTESDKNTNSHTSVAADDGKVHVTNKEQRKCGSDGKVFCGMFDIAGLNLSGGKYRVFYAYKNENDIKEIIEKIEKIENQNPQNFFVKSIFGNNISYNSKTGKTYYQTELKDHNYLPIDMSVEDTLYGVKKSGFLGFYNNLVGDDLDLWKSNDMFFIACYPESGDFGDLTMFNAKDIDLQKKGTEEAVVEEKLYSNIETMSWFGFSYKFVIRAHKILNLFKQPNLIGIHIEFMKEEKSSKISADEFSSYAKFVEAKGNMKHSAYEGLNVYYNYGYNDWEITRVLDKIKAEGAKAEFTRQYGYGAHVFQPFQLLLVGSLEKLSKFTKYDEKDSKQILTV